MKIADDGKPEWRAIPWCVSGWPKHHPAVKVWPTPPYPEPGTAVLRLPHARANRAERCLNGGGSVRGSHERGSFHTPDSVSRRDHERGEGHAIPALRCSLEPIEAGDRKWDGRTSGVAAAQALCERRQGSE
jgi:hypothetical protein